MNTATYYRHSREGGNPSFHQRGGGEVDSRLRGNDGYGGGELIN
jgi:hypothetical protein